MPSTYRGPPVINSDTGPSSMTSSPCTSEPISARIATTPPIQNTSHTPLHQQTTQHVTAPQQLQHVTVQQHFTCQRQTQQQQHSLSSQQVSSQQVQQRQHTPIKLRTQQISQPVQQQPHQQQTPTSAQRIFATVAQLQTQCEVDHAKMVQLEEKLDECLHECPTERAATDESHYLKGGMENLAQEMQTVKLFVEGVDAKVASLAESCEAVIRHNKEMELQTQVHAVTNHGNMSAAPFENLHRQDKTKLGQPVQSVEEILPRLDAVESELQQHRSIDSGFQKFHVEIEDRIKAVTKRHDELDISLEDAVGAMERALVAFEKRTSGKIQDLILALESLHVKVNAQSHQVSALTERFEAFRSPAVHALRVEFTQMREQDQCMLVRELADIRKTMHDATSNRMEAITQVSGAISELQQAVADGAAGNPVYQLLDQRISSTEAKVKAFSQLASVLACQTWSLDKKIVLESSSPNSYQSSPGGEWSAERKVEDVQYELECVANTLKVVDTLANRVTRLEQQLHHLSHEGGFHASGNSRMQLFAPVMQLHDKVSAFQARLLASQLSLQTSAAPEGAQESLPKEHELELLEERIAEMEKEVATLLEAGSSVTSDIVSVPSNSPKAMRAPVSPSVDSREDDAAYGCDDEVSNLRLSEFADNLGSLEGTFRVLAKQLTMLRGGLNGFECPEVLAEGMSPKDKNLDQNQERFSEAATEAGEPTSSTETQDTARDTAHPE